MGKTVFLERLVVFIKNYVINSLYSIDKKLRMFRMKKIFIVFLSVFILSCEKNEESIEEITQGYNMLLIGNSFFKPYAQHLDAMAISAGFENHSATVVFRGGENGRAINFWNDSQNRWQGFLHSL